MFHFFLFAARQQLTVRLCLSAFFKLVDRFCFLERAFFAFKCIWDNNYDNYDSDDGDGKKGAAVVNPWTLVLCRFGRRLRTPELFLSRIL